MKKLLYLFAFMLLCCLAPAKAQRLEIDTLYGVKFLSSLTNLQYGDSVDVEYRIKSPDTTFNGTIHTIMRIGSDPALSSDSSLGGQLLSLKKNVWDTVRTTLIINTQQNLFGNQIVIVWPTGTGFTSYSHRQTVTFIVQRLEMDTVYGVKLMSSLINLQYGDSMDVEYIIHNRGNAAFNGTVYTNMRISADSTVSSDSTVGPGGKVLNISNNGWDTVRTTLIINTQQNLSGNQIVVVWPTGTWVEPISHKQTVTFTALQSDVSRAATALIVFPNPAADRVWLQSARSDVRIRTVSLLDMLGRPQDAPFDGGSLDLRSVAAGNYVLLVSFGDGTTGRYLVQRKR